MARDRLSGWARYPQAECEIEGPRDEAAVHAALAAGPSALARGAGRSYGDSSLNPERTVDMRRMDRMLAFDPETGLLTCEAGVLLEDVIAAFLPRGWFVHATPGTRLVTIGGMIASDVHGKNHHGAGSFCDHLAWIDLAIAPDQVVRCSRTDNPDLFEATCGGMGLTGVILRAAFNLMRLETGWFRQRTSRARNLDETLQLLEQGADWAYTVAWTDCLASGAGLGRSLVFLAEHARVEELPTDRRSRPLERVLGRRLTLPVDCPDITISPLTVRAFNTLYFNLPRPAESLVGLDKYFYPLDSLLSWNRLYGRRGFLQHQCVLPPDTSAEGLRRLLTEISGQGDGSFLVVLKALGAQSFGMLSFPRPGFTLAIDFPARPASLALLDRLDAITAEHGGRIYLTKDARMGREILERGYPRLPEFRAVRARHGLADRFWSLQSRRLEI